MARSIDVIQAIDGLLYDVQQWEEKGESLGETHRKVKLRLKNLRRSLDVMQYARNGRKHGAV